VIKVQIKKILVPLDGSENSLRGLDMAIALARQCNATIVGLCVIHVVSRSEFRGVGSIQKGDFEKIEKFLESTKTRAAKEAIVFTQKILYGDIGYHIVSFAHNKQNKIDLIVIGSRGRGQAKEMFFGSTSNYVIHASKVPVLVVK
jgi:nucleotide-binding universal stress UspA family protein